jgi:hypothetical protein
LASKCTVIESRISRGGHNGGKLGGVRGGKLGGVRGGKLGGVRGGVYPTREERIKKREDKERY